MSIQPPLVQEGRRSRASRRWMRFLTDGPSDRFMLWTRRVLLFLWVALAVVEVPALVQRAQHIHNVTRPGPERIAAMRGLALKAVTVLVVAPLFLFAVIGYGIRVRPAPEVWSTGGPWFETWWRPHRRQKQWQRRGSQ